MNTSLVLYPLCLHPGGECLISTSKSGQHLSQHQVDQKLVLDSKCDLKAQKLSSQWVREERSSYFLWSVVLFAAFSVCDTEARIRQCPDHTFIHTSDALAI